VVMARMPLRLAVGNGRHAATFTIKIIHRDLTELLENG